MRILFDIGGTNMRIARSEKKGEFSRIVIVPTPQSFAEGMETFVKVATQIAEGFSIEVVTGGITGQLDATKQKLVVSRSLPDWTGKMMGHEIAQRLKAPFWAENDTAVVGLGEAHAGAGRDAKILVYMTISTGVGGARIVNGVIDPSSYGFEPGHQIVDVAGSQELEALVSGRAVERKYGKKPREITDMQIWDSVAKVASVGIANTLLHWSPDTIVLGGSMMKIPGIPIEKIQQYVPPLCSTLAGMPRIVKAELGDVGGLHGASVLAENFLHPR